MENHNVTQVLVDYEIIPPEIFFRNNQYIHEQIERRSYGYRNLVDKNSELIMNYGFKYLNSIDCLNIFDALDNEIEETLKFINKEKLFQIRKSWNEHEEIRNNEMINNIYDYSKNNTYNAGLFLIGTAHRKSIIEKIQKHNESEKINWNYSKYENII